MVACDENIADSDNMLIQQIPENSKVILHTDDLQEVTKYVSSLKLYNKLGGLSRVIEVRKAASFLENYNIDDPSFIALSIEGKNEVVITLISEIGSLKRDSTVTRKQLNYDGKVLYTDVVKEQPYYYTDYNDVHIASSSRLIVESLMRREIANYVFDASFNEVFNQTQDADFAIYVKGSNDEWLKQFLLGKNINDRTKDGLWYELEPKINTNGLQLDGIITYKDSLKMYQSLFNKVTPQKNRLVNIAPVNTAEFTSITYQNPEVLLKNLNNYHATQLKLPSFHKTIFSNTDEVAELSIDGKMALAFSLKPYETFFVDIDSMSVADYTYRDKKIYTLDQSLKTQSLKPLLHSRTYSHAVQLPDYLIFAENQKTLETIISNLQNNTVIGKQLWWEKIKGSLSDNSTLLKLNNINAFKEMAVVADKEDKKIIDLLNTDTHPLWVSQYVHEDEYAHYHFIVPTASRDGDRSLTSQIAAYRSTAPILAGPFLFPNHITKKHDIAFQDKDLKMHLISSKGSLIWSRQLDSKINGTIHVVDGYKNGRKQLVFSTNDMIYYLDRKGRDVNAYPKKFKNGVTQPVSVFDYDNSRNYRFLVTSGKNLTMLNIQGNVVTGFKYAANENITTTPQHYRSGSKDYICFAKENQSIAILNRTGRVRTPVSRTLEVKGGLYFDDNSVLLHTANNGKATINLTTGNVEIEHIELSNSSIYKMEYGIEIIQDNNVLFINGQELVLPYGTYTACKISLIDETPYIHLVEEGEHKVYIIDQQATIVPGLPVYGKGSSELEQSDIRYLVTKDERDIIIYKW
jgi:hypothetical protein